MSRKNWKFLKQKLLTAFIPWHAHVWHVQAMFKMFDFYKVGVKKLKMQHDNAAIHLYCHVEQARKSLLRKAFLAKNVETP